MQMEPSLTGLAESQDPQLNWQMEKHTNAGAFHLRGIHQLQPAVEGEQSNGKQ